MKCVQCNTELPKIWSTDICLECSRQNVKEIFKEFPDLKEAFINTIKEMKEELDN